MRIQENLRELKRIQIENPRELKAIHDKSWESIRTQKNPTELKWTQANPAELNYAQEGTLRSYSFSALWSLCYFSQDIVMSFLPI